MIFKELRKPQVWLCDILSHLPSHPLTQRSRAAKVTVTRPTVLLAATLDVAGLTAQGYGWFMPIYEYACPKCRVVFNFLSKRINPTGLPTCPKCGNKRMAKQVTRFAMSRGLKEPAAASEGMEGGPPMPDFDDPRMERAMMDLERDMEHLDENNPRHMAHMMRKMKDLMPPGSVPQELDVAIKRLEAGEDPEKIEEDMGDVLGEFMGGEEGGSPGGGGYAHDSGLYDY